MKGFTLIELMIVSLILLILTFVSLSGYYKSIVRSRDGKALKVLAGIRGANVFYITDNAQNDKFLAEKISDLQVNFTKSIENKIVISDDSVSDSDFVTSYETQAGTVIRNGSSSVGKSGYLNSSKNVLEIRYDNKTGLIMADGLGGDGYLDTKDRFWASY